MSQRLSAAALVGSLLCTGHLTAAEPAAAVQLSGVAGLAVTEALGEFQPTEGLTGTVRCQSTGISTVAMLSLAQALGEVQRTVQVQVELPTRTDRFAALLDGSTELIVLPYVPTAEELKTLVGDNGRELVAVPFALNPVVFYVHRANPVASLSLAQMRSMIARHPEANARSETWGDVGVSGPFAVRPIAVMLTGRDFEQHGAFRRNVLQVGDVRIDARTSPTPAAALSEVGADPAAFCIASLLYATPATRIVPLARADGTLVWPDVNAVQGGSYPLLTTLTMVALRRDGKLNDLTREVLRYAISRRAQRQMVSLGVFPITVQAQQQSAERLR